MRRLLLALLALAPLAASAQGIIRLQRTPPEVLVWSQTRNAALAATAGMGGTYVQGQPLSLTAVSFMVTSPSGGGAGGTTIRACIVGASGTCSDGTEICTFAPVPCTDTTAYGPRRAVPASGTCLFSSGARVMGEVSVAGCTMTQPSISNISFHGQWR